MPEVRSVAQNMFDSIMRDEYPRTAAMVDFGLDTPKHYEALYYGVRAGTISVEQLDDALGDGNKLTELANKDKHNPHKGIVFKTPYDDMMDED